METELITKTDAQNIVEQIQEAGFNLDGLLEFVAWYTTPSETYKHLQRIFAELCLPMLETSLQDGSISRKMYDAAVHLSLLLDAFSECETGYGRHIGFVVEKEE